MNNPFANIASATANASTTSASTAAVTIAGVANQRKLICSIAASHGSSGSGALTGRSTLLTLAADSTAIGNWHVNGQTVLNFDPPLLAGSPGSTIAVNLPGVLQVGSAVTVTYLQQRTN
jgi:hypothetical protein